MRKYLIIVASALVLIIITLRAQQTSNLRMESLAKRNDCLKCHRKADNKQDIGPTFEQIASKFRADSVTVQVLVERVKKGSKGQWTEISRGVPMPPYSGRLSDEQIRELVQWLIGEQ